MNEAAEVRKAQGNECKGMNDMCCQVPTFQYTKSLWESHMVLQELYGHLQNFETKESIRTW